MAHCKPQHRSDEWLDFLRVIGRRTPKGKGKALHVICDNYATHKLPNVKAWLKEHPRFHIHITPTSASWLNMVERFFRSITVDRLRHGASHSVADLKKAIAAYITTCNKSSKPFVWAAKTSDIPPGRKLLLELTVLENDKVLAGCAWHHTSSM